MNFTVLSPHSEYSNPFISSFTVQESFTEQIYSLIERANVFPCAHKIVVLFCSHTFSSLRECATSLNHICFICLVGKNTFPPGTLRVSPAVIQKAVLNVHCSFHNPKIPCNKRGLEDRKSV